MVPYSDYSGSRLISYEFGLVSDFYTNLPYSVPYYLKLVFKKGDKDNYGDISTTTSI